MTKLGQVASIRMGYPFRSRLEHDATGAIAVVQMKDIDDASLLHVEDAVRVDLPDFNEHHLIRRGDLVFRSRGRTNSVALVSADVGPAVLAAPMLLIRPIEVLPAYLLWYINLPAVQATLAAQEGSARAVGDFSPAVGHSATNRRNRTACQSGGKDHNRINGSA